jgi:glutamate 5-kinase
MPKYKTIVVKIGSSTLTNKQGKLDRGNLHRIVSELARIKKGGMNVIVVSSGAIVTGSGLLKFKGKPSSIPEKQAAAAVGQSELMHEYSKAFKKYGITVAQILLTKSEIIHNERHMNTKHALAKLLSLKVVPIVNENDTVAVDEIRIGDNDNLSALVARLVRADLLIMLTDVDGFMIKGKVVSNIPKITKKIENAAGHSVSEKGTGGMITKVQAARICLSSGITAAIVSGRKKNAIIALIKGIRIGTIFGRTK